MADPESVQRISSAFNPSSRFHFQLGIFQQAERRALTSVVRNGYDVVEATIHDPPFLTFPYFQFSSDFLTRLSRGFDWYLSSFGLQRRMLERLSRIFVLSDEGRRAVLRMAPSANVIAIPHIVRKDSIWPPKSPLGKNLLYFGFIGRGKGLDYVLALHRELLKIRPGTHLHIVGQPATSRDQRYVERLAAEYRDDLTFHGFVPEDKLDGLFEGAAHVILPYRQYKYVFPASGSAIHAIRRARIVWTCPVNAMTEVIRDGENGFMLTMEVERDARRLASVLEDEGLTRRISDGARESAIGMSQYPYHVHFAGDGTSPSNDSSHCRVSVA
ncbi:MAG: glycosyltransferase family 4 protein [Porphyrobacter sp.]|nr:glycosyltransferase family 4 protein [Porphyrobacter sp.]